MAMTEIKGITLKSRYDFVKHIYGEDAFQKVLPQLKPETRALFEDELKIRATSWYNLDIQTDFETTVCRVLADGDEGVYRRMGAFSADFHDSNFSFGELRDPSKFLQMYVVIFGRYCRPSRMEVEMVGKTECYVRLHELTSTFPNCESNIGYIVRNMENLKLKDIVAEETQCTKDEGVDICEYHIKWRV